MSAKINPEDAANIIEQIGNYIKKFDDIVHWSEWGGKCPHCTKETLVKSATGSFSFRTLSGIIRCTSCHYRQSLTGHLASSMIALEPMPEGAKPTYDCDIDILNVIFKKEDDYE